MSDAGSRGCPRRQTLKHVDAAMPARKTGGQPRQSLSKPSVEKKSGERQKALHWQSQKPESGVVPAELSFSAGMRACKKSGDWKTALYLLSQMPAAGVVPDRISFNAGISACEQSSEWQMAVYLLSLMPAATVVPGRISFNAGISACEKSGEWQMAMYLLSEMPAASVVPGQKSFHAGVSACEKGGVWQVAVYLLSQMPSAGVVPKEITLIAGIQSCGAARIWELALYLFASIRGNQLQPDVASYRQAIDAALPETVSFELFDQAMQDQTWPDMLRKGGALLDLRDHSCGSAMLGVTWWLAEVVAQQLDRLPHASVSFEIITGSDKEFRMPGQPTGLELQVSVQRLSDARGLPYKIHPIRRRGRLLLDPGGIDPGQLRALYPSSATSPRQ